MVLSGPSLLILDRIAIPRVRIWRCVRYVTVCKETCAGVKRILWNGRCTLQVVHMNSKKPTRNGTTRTTTAPRWWLPVPLYISMMEDIKAERYIELDFPFFNFFNTIVYIISVKLIAFL